MTTMIRFPVSIGSVLLCLLLLGCPDSQTTTPQASGDATPAAAPDETSPAAESETPVEPVASSSDSTPAETASAPTPEPPANSVADAAPADLPPLPDPYDVPFKNPVGRARAAEGWISLFDGHSLMGWNRKPGGADWQVVDGIITASEGPIDLLCTNVPFANYELEIDFRMEAEGNSGIFLRTDEAPGKVDVDCYELNIADTHPQGFTTGALVGRQATKEPITAPAGGKPSTSPPTAASSPSISTATSSSTTPTSRTPPRQRPDRFAEERRQDRVPQHLPKAAGNGTAFQRRRPHRLAHRTKRSQRVQRRRWEIQVVNGRGFLETDGHWSDFLFQAESRTNAPELNSGYFFRGPTIEDNCNGYEAQINNAIIDGDRKQPKDYGTGAIYRRVKARYVVPNDEEWFTTTLLAFGPQISVWIDGYQVVDWKDERPPAEDGRNGQYTGPGHIALQGHDPTTTLSFRI